MELLEIMASARNGKPIGVFEGDGFPGKCCDLWQKMMATYNFQTADIGTSIAYVMAVKDDDELSAIKEASRVCNNIFEKYLKQRIVEIIDAKRVSNGC